MELWKDIEGYEGLYQVSNRGRVKSLKRNIIRTNGRTLPVRERILKPIMNLGYEHVILGNMNNKHKRKQLKVHRLVAQAFIPNPEKKPHINHKNFIRDDNWIENLEWCTAKENSRHWVKNKMIIPRGELNGMSKLTEDDVFFIKNNWNKISAVKLMEMFDVGKTTIYDIIHERSWKHLWK